MEKYTPKIYPMAGKGRYIEFLLEGAECRLCKKIMLKKSKPEYQGLFPNWLILNQEAQMKEVGIVFQSAILVDNEHICIECADLGKADFVCALCDERKPTNKQKDSFGDPSEFLCTDCYESKPAKVWDEKVDALQESHRYDFG